MTTQIKICGLSTPETMDAAIDAGATHVGLVHYEKSPRHVALEDAAKLRRRVPEGVKLVLVTVAMQPDYLARCYEALRPDVIQFHGSETAEWMALVRKTIKIETWRALGLREAATLERARQFADSCDLLLFDAPAKELPGGNGVSFQWDLLQGWEPFMPWALAGGLTPENVGEAIAITGAPLVDASSGLETAPGVKSVELIRAFCEAVKSA
ncbi:MAG: phosphoribosylanthranilate isomerase [Alphaproteobacteria bacterium]|nr:phosphoribosylanthranilate isomerase [Alphaproteobacteria bacterium]